MKKCSIQYHLCLFVLMLVSCFLALSLQSSSAESLTTYSFPKEQQIVDDDEFYHDTSIGVLHIHSNIRSISISVNEQLMNLVSYNVDDQCEYFTAVDGVLYTKDMKVLIAYPRGKTDTIFRIPDSVVYVGKLAFSGNDYIETIILGTNVSHVLDQAFLQCSNLKHVQMNLTLLSIGREAFAETMISFVSFPENLYHIGAAAFYGTPLSFVALPPSLLVVGSEAFGYCMQLKCIIIPSSVIYIDTPICGWNGITFEDRIEVLVPLDSYASIVLKSNDSILVNTY